MTGQIHLVEVLVGERHQQLRSRAGLYAFCFAQPVKRIAVAPRSHVEIPE